MMRTVFGLMCLAGSALATRGGGTGPSLPALCSALCSALCLTWTKPVPMHCGQTGLGRRTTTNGRSSHKGVGSGQPGSLPTITTLDGIERCPQYYHSVGPEGFGISQKISTGTYF